MNNMFSFQIMLIYDSVALFVEQFFNNFEDLIILSICRPSEQSLECCVPRLIKLKMGLRE